jgi:phosphate-selective porin
VSIGDAAFPVFADRATAPHEATEAAIGLNWFLQRQTKIQTAYEMIRFRGGSALGAGDRPTERYATVRLQVMF